MRKAAVEEVYLLEQELNLLDPGHVRIYRDAFEDLILEVEGDQVYREIQVLRSFPVSAGDRFIALRDSEGNELGIIRDISQLDRHSRRILEAELERVYFVPRITRVDTIVERFHIPRWEVETDRGPRAFEVRSGRHGRDVRILGGGRILIRDADGNQYEIPDYRRLDLASQALIESQI